MKVFVTVGTDVHPFDRLVRWCDDLAERRPDLDVFVQYGSSTPPAVATGSAYLDHEELVSRMSGADVVVTHGGPATISEARRTRRPVVVPRDPDLGEHVDGHQIAFARLLASVDRIVLATDQDGFGQALEVSLAGDSALERGVISEPEGIRRFAEIADAVIAGRRHRRPHRARRRRHPTRWAGSILSGSSREQGAHQ